MRQDNLKATSSYVRASWLAIGFLAVIISGMAGILFGPSNVGSVSILKELADHLPFVEIDSGLSDRHQAIIWQIRLPRVVLGLLVGAMLSAAGGTYQGVFRNPLADPYVLGVAAGAGGSRHRQERQEAPGELRPSRAVRAASR